MLVHKKDKTIHALYEDKESLMKENADLQVSNAGLIAENETVRKQLEQTLVQYEEDKTRLLATIGKNTTMHERQLVYMQEKLDDIEARKERLQKEKEDDRAEYASKIAEAKDVAAFHDTLSFHYEVEDSSTVLMRMENGCQCVVQSNFNIPDAVPSKLEIFGTAGSIVAYGTLSQEEGGTIEVIAADSSLGYDAQQTRNEVKKMEVKVEFGNMYTKELDSFGRSHRDGAPIEVPAADAIYAQKVIQAAYESSETGKFIEL